MPNRSKQKGTRLELEVVHLAKEFDLEAKRVPLSGSCAGFKDDIELEGQRYECKSRSTGFKQIYQWLFPCFGLFIKADRHEPLVVIRAKDYMELLEKLKKEGKV